MNLFARKGPWNGPRQGKQVAQMPSHQRPEAPPPPKLPPPPLKPPPPPKPPPPNPPPPPGMKMPGPPRPERPVNSMTMKPMTAAAPAISNELAMNHAIAPTMPPPTSEPPSLPKTE